MSSFRTLEQITHDYKEWVLLFIEQLQHGFSECDIVHTHKMYNSMSETFMMSTITEHANCMIMPLISSTIDDESSKFTYANPLTRLKMSCTSENDELFYRQATHYDAYMYQDSHILTANQVPLLFTQLKLQDKIESLRLEDPDDIDGSQSAIWSFIQEINKIAISIKNLNPPKHFSHDEVKTEIERKASETVCQHKLSKVFKTIATQLIETVHETIKSNANHRDSREEHTEDHTKGILKENSDSLLNYVCDTEESECIASWNLLMSSLSGNNTECLYQICEAQDWAMLQQTFEYYRHNDENNIKWTLLPLEHIEVPNEDIWTRFNQMNVLARVFRSTPTHLLEIIESKASKLSTQIAEGSFNMDSREIMQIGEEIMTQCNIEDLQLFSQMINRELSSILKAFTQLQQPRQMGEQMDGSVQGLISVMSLLSPK